MKLSCNNLKFRRSSEIILLRDPSFPEQIFFYLIARQLLPDVTLSERLIQFVFELFGLGQLVRTSQMGLNYHKT